jgi:hypothetical protein
MFAAPINVIAIQSDGAGCTQRKLAKNNYLCIQAFGESTLVNPFPSQGVNENCALKVSKLG